MDQYIQAVVLGIVQGLTEFLPISSSGHLIIVPWLLGWDDPFITSLAFSVMLHIGTLAALLIYFGQDWIRLVPAGLATIRDRSFKDDPDRKLAWLLVVASIPAAIAGFLLNDIIESAVRGIGLVTVMLVVGAAIMWIADRPGVLTFFGRPILTWRQREKGVEDVTFPIAFGLGVAQSLALIPGISRSGISISAARFAGLERQAAARFSFLMATPITFGAALFELRKLATGEAGVDVAVGPLLAGMVAAFLAGMLAIKGLLGYLRSHSLNIFVAYRLVLALAIALIWLVR